MSDIPLLIRPSNVRWAPKTLNPVKIRRYRCAEDSPEFLAKFGVEDKPQPNTVVGRPCHWCKRPMTSRRLSYGTGIRSDAATRDHVIPKSKGGKTKVWACFRCNNLKGNMLPDEWDAWMRANPSKLDWDR